MNSPFLLLLMAAATVPSLRATLPGLRAQGLDESKALSTTLEADINSLSNGVLRALTDILKSA